MTRKRFWLIWLCLAATAPVAFGNTPTTIPAIEQAKVDAAMAKMRERQSQRESAPATAPTQVQVEPQQNWDPATYPRDMVILRKLELLKQYDREIAHARQALRRHEIAASEVRDVVSEQSALQQLPLDRFRDLLMEADARNARRIMRYREAFGELPKAATTVVTILMKSGTIDSAQPLPDDPLSEEIEEAHGVRRAYFHFVLPARDAAGAMRRHNGYVEFQLASEQGLWLPTWADVEGDPIPLFDVEAFIPLRPYRIAYSDNGSFVVTNERTTTAPELQTFSLLSVRGLGGLRAPVLASSRSR